jgi:hypothetical protein
VRLIFDQYQKILKWDHSVGICGNNICDPGEVLKF